MHYYHGGHSGWNSVRTAFYNYTFTVIRHFFIHAITFTILHYTVWGRPFCYDTDYDTVFYHMFDYH